MVASSGNLCCPWRPWSSFLSCILRGKMRDIFVTHTVFQSVLLRGNFRMSWHPLLPLELFPASLEPKAGTPRQVCNRTICLVAGQSLPALASSAPGALPRLLEGQARDTQASHRPVILLLSNGCLFWQPFLPLAALELFPASSGAKWGMVSWQLILYTSTNLSCCWVSVACLGILCCPWSSSLPP